MGHGQAGGSRRLEPRRAIPPETSGEDSAPLKSDSNRTLSFDGRFSFHRGEGDSAFCRGSRLQNAGDSCKFLWACCRSHFVWRITGARESMYQGGWTRQTRDEGIWHRNSERGRNDSTKDSMSSTPAFPADMRPKGPPRPDLQPSNALGRNNKRQDLLRTPKDDQLTSFREAVHHRPTEAICVAFALGFVAALMVRKSSQ